MSEPLIQLNDLKFAYADGTQALKGVSFTVCRSERVGLVGPNGAGKSTLILHLNGVFRSDGSVRICGLPVTKRNLLEVRSRVGLVFQDPDDQLFMPTVFEDIAFGPLNMGLSVEDVRGRVERALEAVGLSGLEAKAPYHLSGGQKRAVAIATVLSMEPQVLVMDEPASNLDPRGRRRLIHLLKTFDVTLLIASHDLEMVLELCERCILLDDGRVVADRPARELLADAALLEAHGLEKPLSLR
jgi:cobalt/nickel transport system ATP-binding protein